VAFLLVLNGGEKQKPNNSFHRIAARLRLWKNQTASLGRLAVTAGVMCQESPRSWRLKGIGLRWSGCSHQQTLKRDGPSIILKIRARNSYSTAVTPQHIFAKVHRMTD
jgi:hypothetical protein